MLKMAHVATRGQSFSSAGLNEDSHHLYRSVFYFTLLFLITHLKKKHCWGRVPVKPSLSSLFTRTRQKERPSPPDNWSLSDRPRVLSPRPVIVYCPALMDWSNFSFVITSRRNCTQRQEKPVNNRGHQSSQEPQPRPHTSLAPSSSGTHPVLF